MEIVCTEPTMIPSFPISSSASTSSQMGAVDVAARLGYDGGVRVGVVAVGSGSGGHSSTGC